jgi:hypothetical protein
LKDIEIITLLEDCVAKKADSIHRIRESIKDVSEIDRALFFVLVVTLNF